MNVGDFCPGVQEVLIVPNEEELNNGFTIGEWEVIPAQGLLRSGDRVEKPEPKVFAVLLALARRNGDLVTRDDLIDEIWDGRPTSDEPINRCLSQLRHHLGDKDRPYRYIETLTRRGYRLNTDVELQQSTEPKQDPEHLTERLGKHSKLWVIAATFVVVIVAATYSRIGPLETGTVESIAVLPFENLSGNPDDRYLVSGFKVELVQTLHSVPDVAVIHGRVAYPNKEVDEIAEILGVDAVLIGELQRSGNVLKITYRLARGSDGEVVSSGEIAGQVAEVFALQGRLAGLVRNDLFGESPRQLISASRKPNSEAYDRYMRGLYAFERRGRGRPENLDAAIRLFEQSIEIDPGFGPAYLSLATAYALLPDYRNAPLVETHAKALQVVEQGIAVDSSISDAAGAVYGFVFHKQRQWTKAEIAYLRATNAATVDSNAFNWYSLMLAGVGRLDDALEKIIEAQKIDPSSAVINSRVAIIYTWLGDAEKAAEYYKRSNRLGASGETHLLGNALLLIREGRQDEAASLTRAGVSMSGGDASWVDPVIAAIADRSLTGTALAAIDAAFQSQRLDPRLNIIARTMLGDIDGAMQVATALAQSAEIFEMDMLFLPELRQFRQNPAFRGLMDDLGVQRYWDENGCSWQDDEVRCAD